MATSLKPESKRARLKAILLRRDATKPHTNKKPLSSSPSISTLSSTGPAVAGQLTPPPPPAPVPISTVPTSLTASTDKRDFWAEALQKLSPEDRGLVHKHVPVSSSVDTNRAHNDMLQLAQHAQKRCHDHTWTVSFLGRTFSYREEAGKVINWLQRFKAAGDVAANADPIHAGLPWAVIRVFLQAAVSDQEQLGAIFIGVNKIAYVLNRCGIYSQLYLEGSHMGAVQLNLENALSELYTLILQFLANALRLTEKNAAYRALSAFWKPEDIIEFEGKSNAIESRIEIEAHNYDRLVDRQARYDTSKDLESLKGSMDLLNLRTENIWIQQENEKQGMILRWVSSIPHLDHHDTAVQGRSEDTGAWISNHEEYKVWETSKSSKILWLHGIPGAGKTKLVTRVIDNADQKSNGHALAFFYCNRAEESRRNEEDVFRSFVKQLGFSSDSCKIHRSLLAIYKKKQESGFASECLTLGECETLLVDFMSAFTRTTLILDALDECYEESRSRLIKCFTRMIKRVPNLKILISSRRNDDIKRQLRMEANLGIEATDNEDDIRKFVLEKIEQDRLRREDEGLPLISDKLKTEIVTTLFTKSHGMFQWTSLQIAQLLTLQRAADIRARLGKLPTGLKNAYHDLWVLIEDQKGSGGTVAKRAIQWIMASDSPLPIQVLIAAVCQDPDKNEILPIDIGEGFVLGSCQNLIIVDTNKYCRFAHLSIEEYFEEYAPWERSECDETVANVCLVFLMKFSNLEEEAEETEEEEEEEEEEGEETQSLNGLYNFAAEEWHHHTLRIGEHTNSDRNLSLLLDFFGSPTATEYTAFSRWRDQFPAKFEWASPTTSFPSNALLFVCYLGLARVLSQWLETTGTAIEVNTNVSGVHGNALSAAIFGAKQGIVRLLLENGADANAPVTTRYGNCALVVAMNLKDERCAKLLLENGADANTPSRSRPSVLISAVTRGDEEMTRLLIKKGADVNLYANVEYLPNGNIQYGLGALAHALDMKNEKLAELLIESGADVSAPARGLQGLLATAADNGYERVVQLMIDRGADVIAQREETWDTSNALVKAVESGKGKIARLLIESGANLNTRTQNYSTVFGTALARKIDEDTVELMIEKGADVNTRSERYGNMLILAVSSRSEKIVRLMIEKGADANEQFIGNYYFYNSALEAAVKHQEIKTAQVLLDNGADINMKPKANNSMLGLAVGCAVEEMVHFLIQRGADVNAREGEYFNVLGLAAARRREGVVRLLVEHGADAGVLDQRLGREEEEEEEEEEPLSLDIGLGISESTSMEGIAR